MLAPIDDGQPDRGPVSGWSVSFLPRRVLEAVLAKALAENSFLVPRYAGVSVALGGRPLTAPGLLSPAPDRLLLGSASQTLWLNSSTSVIRLDLWLQLVNRELLLATVRRQARLSGTIILAAAFAAFIGLLAAHRAFARQLRLNEMKSNFVASVSHELRAPIASVRLMAESLERGKCADRGKQQEYFRFIVQECRRLAALVENVLDFSRIEQGRKQYEFEPTDLRALVEQTVKLMQAYAVERQVKLELRDWFIHTVSPYTQPMLDGRAFQQALVNLIDNALKHSSPGQVVMVGCDTVLETTCPVLQLWIEDHGRGIPPAEHQKIFERFYRRGSELRRETQGVGIGLSIVKHIVEAHGGRVLVRSDVGQGSRFTIELPLPSEVNRAEGSNQKHK